MWFENYVSIFKRLLEKFFFLYIFNAIKINFLFEPTYIYFRRSRERLFIEFLYYIETKSKLWQKKFSSCREAQWKLNEKNHLKMNKIVVGRRVFKTGTYYVKEKREIVVGE